MLQQLLSALEGHGAQNASLAEELQTYIAGLVDDDAGESGGQEAFGRAADLQNLLTEIRIAANGGDRDAREELEEGLAVVEAAAEAGDLPGHAIMVLFQIFGEAEVDPGDALRKAMLINVDADRQSDVPVELRLSDAAADLAELDEDVAQTSFAAMIRYMPKPARYDLVHALGGRVEDTSRTILLGCLLDSDPDLVRIAAEGLIASARNAPVPSRLVERLVLIRGLVPAPIHPAVDTTIAALRPKASAPVAREQLQLVKCVASICDGAGAQSLLALMRRGKTHVMVSFMVKTHSGLADAMVLNDFSKREFDAIAKGMGIVIVPVSLALMQRRLAIALAVNHEKGAAATFGFVQALEALGIAALRPDSIETEALLDELLTESTSLVPLTLAEAAARLDDMELTETWFEAGPDCDERLDRLRGTKQRHKAALAYIEERRAFWAAQCASAALVLRDSGKPFGPLWQDFAVIGRHFAGREPVANNPLAHAMAQRTVEAHESQRY
ncbi:hypothetical protein [Mesorhizobium sp. IMUNJ 23232]|uniref:hypothetical protein n=1 Tax=Mesorhizobium sp. IMUNJ 23232 TaxID=3376064 RepID=UPI003790061B